VAAGPPAAARLAVTDDDINIELDDIMLRKGHDTFCAGTRLLLLLLLLLLVKLKKRSIAVGVKLLLFPDAVVEVL
jgi:hypothetical protein